MKIINEKGKLFGLVNVIDLLIVLVLAVGVLGVMKYKDIGNVVDKLSADELGKVYITYSVNGVKDVSVDGVEVGDVFFDEVSNKIIGSVVEKSAVNTKISTTNSEGEFTYSEIPDRFDLLVKIEAEGSWNDLEINVNGDDIHIGEKQEITSHISNFSAVIYNIETE